ncbi:carbohydrate ABC transporter permease [Nonomuraea aurantiaca]|jgi:ABC-type glycerol-3-phosphate transport system permease component|uniref:carbohydrate ABC transporter permease n=1 Tax=Nonomuraea aurantiaca TaxID=2878562 RepID=UPI001CD94515|nr:carbohydrate ABC transporter permease [Nonomuraea aurantiaca]MCA2226031.1 carbohydrate ABC transporter permease [Nonomuraea aurantiaca]
MRRLIGDILLPRATAIALWAWVAFNLALVGWVGIQSLKDSGEVWLDPFGLPKTLRWDNFSSAWQAAEFSAAAMNSVVLTLFGSAMIVAVSAPAAYVLARSSRRVAGHAINYFAIGLSIPIQTILVPIVVIKLSVYSFMEDWVTGWWDNRITLLVFQVALSVPFAVFVLTGYMRSLPHEIEEAAEIDGAGPLRAFIQVIVPVARPGLTTVLVLNVMGLWNETLLALLIAPLPEERNLPAALLGLYSSMQYSSDWGGMFAGIVILVYPMIVLYIWLGRRIVDGMTAGISR